MVEHGSEEGSFASREDLTTPSGVDPLFVVETKAAATLAQSVEVMTVASLPDNETYGFHEFFIENLPGDTQSTEVAEDVLIKLIQDAQLDSKNHSKAECGTRMRPVVDKELKHLAEDMADHFGNDGMPQVTFQLTRLINLGYQEKYRARDEPPGDRWYSEVNVKYGRINNAMISDMIAFDNIYFDLTYKTSKTGAALRNYGKTWINVYIPLDTFDQFCYVFRKSTNWLVSNRAYTTDEGQGLVCISANINSYERPKFNTVAKITGGNIQIIDQGTIQDMCHIASYQKIYKGTGFFKLSMNAITTLNSNVAPKPDFNNRCRVKFTLLGLRSFGEAKSSTSFVQVPIKAMQESQLGLKKNGMVECNATMTRPVVNKVLKRVTEDMADHFGNDGMPQVTFQLTGLTNLGYKEQYRAKNDPPGDRWYSDVKVKYGPRNHAMISESIAFDNIYFDLTYKNSNSGAALRNYGKTWINVYIPLDTFDQFCYVFRKSTNWLVSNRAYTTDVGQGLVRISANIDNYDRPKFNTAIIIPRGNIQIIDHGTIQDMCHIASYQKIYKGTGFFKLSMNVITTLNSTVAPNPDFNNRCRVKFTLLGLRSFGEAKSITPFYLGANAF